MEQIQTVITVPLKFGGKYIVRVEGLHVSPFDVRVDFQQSVGRMAPVAHDVRHETWDDGE